MVAATKTAKKPTFKPGTLISVPHDQITRKFNIRTPENTKKVDDILNSIKSNGVEQALIVNQDGLLVDGFRRYHACEVIKEETGTPVTVNARVIEIKEADIPAYQYRTGIRKNYTGTEKNRAIYEYALLNPEVQDKDIAEIFEVTKPAVFYATKVIRASLALKDLVVGDYITQNAAKSIVDYFLGDSDVNSITDKQRQKIETFASQILPEIEKDKSFKAAKNENFKPWTIRSINAYLNSIGKALIDTAQTERKAKKVKVETLLDNFLKVCQFVPEGDVFKISGSITKEDLEELQKALAELKQGKVSEVLFEDSADINGSYWQVWQEQANAFDGVTFIQISSVNYATYDEQIDLVGTHSPVQPTEEFGSRVLILKKPEMNAAIKKLTDSGVDVLKMVKDKTTKKKSQEANKDTEVPAEITGSDTQDSTDNVKNDQYEDSLGLDLTTLNRKDALTEDMTEEDLGTYLEEIANEY